MASRVIIDRELLHKKLTEWLDDVERNPGNWDDGESNVFRLEGGRVGHDGNDDTIVGFTLTVSRSESGL